MKSTLVELPPEDLDLEESGASVISAPSVEQLAEKTLIGNEAVLNRVLLPGRLFGSYLTSRRSRRSAPTWTAGPISTAWGC